MTVSTKLPTRVADRIRHDADYDAFACVQHRVGADLDALFTDLRESFLPDLQWAIHADEQGTTVHLGLALPDQGTGFPGPVELVCAEDADSYVVGGVDGCDAALMAAEHVAEVHASLSALWAQLYR